MPNPPIIFPLLYSGTPPQKKISPPAISFAPPPVPSAGARKFGLNRFDWPRLHSEWPGCVKVYSRAVESASASRLNAFAVYALALAMAWLPGHTCVASSCEAATAHSLPSRFTTAPHIRSPWNNPPASPLGAAVLAAFFSSVFSCAAAGSPAELACACGGAAAGGGVVQEAANNTNPTTVVINGLEKFVCIDSLLRAY